jgi:signal transduction histidine kinase
MAALSRELHDDLGQVLSLLKMHLATAVRLGTHEQRRTLELGEALPLVDVALSRLREVCGELRPSELSDFGLGAALVTLANAASRASGVTVSFKEHGDPIDLGTGMELGLFRVAQQALTNALRHSGAPTVWITLHWRAAGVEVSVRDNNVGFDPEAMRRPNQQGLHGMRERMELLGGLLRVDASRGVGTSVSALAPASTELAGEP